MRLAKRGEAEGHHVMAKFGEATIAKLCKASPKGGELRQRYLETTNSHGVGRWCPEHHSGEEAQGDLGAPSNGGVEVGVVANLEEVEDSTANLRPEGCRHVPVRQDPEGLEVVVAEQVCLIP